MLTYTNKISVFTDDEGLSAVRIEGLDNFLISQIFDCGQCFRFDKVDENSFEGVAYGRYVKFSQTSPDVLEIHNSTAEEYENIWRHYLALDVDYSAIRADISSKFKAASHGKDKIMPLAMEYGSGIRILRQESWETVCSFIISQNNNIPRIKKIIAGMCEKYGDEIICGEKTYYSFPTPQTLIEAGVGELMELKTGFRAKYITDAAQKAVHGGLDFEAINSMTFEEAMETLCDVKGIGPKVASCAMLFGFGRTEAFPIDVWMKRVIEKYYPEGLDIPALGKYAGIAQQYLFYYERYNIGK